MYTLKTMGTDFEVRFVDDGIIRIRAGKNGQYRETLFERVALRQEEIDIKTALASLHGDVIGIISTEVVGVNVCTGNEHSPSVGAHYVRNGAVGHYVLYVHSCFLTAACDACTLVVAKSEKTLVL